MLINNDKYGGVGKESRLVSSIASAIRVLDRENRDLSPPNLLSLQKQTIRNFMIDRFKNAKTRLPRVTKLCDDLDKQIEDSEDLAIFALTCESIMLPINHALDNFQADIEVDKWVPTKDRWLIGISCKRTIRERWKQVSSAESSVLSKFRIKHIFHIITYDEDLSDDKISQLGLHRHIFYLSDESRRLRYALDHVGLRDYVRPISSLVEDLRSHQ